MAEWIVSSSALILVVIFLRAVLKGKISLRVRYALWVPVLVRLLIPVSFGGTALSVENLTRKAAASEPMRFVAVLSEIELPKMSYRAAYAEVAKEYADRGVQIEEMPLEEYAATVDYEIMDRMKGELSVGEVVQTVWLCGIAVVGFCFMLSNCRLHLGLKKTRRQLSEDTVLPVYLSDAIDTPCLFGLLHPAIYLTEQAAEEEQTRRHAVEHELTHYHHKDNLWAILRSVCIAVHWYNPLVWCAAVMSRNDAELACDESTILRLGEGERASYGRTLIYLTCEKRAKRLNTATTMTGSGRVIRERIACIAQKPKKAGYAVIAVVVVVTAAVGCTFTGAREADETFDVVVNHTASHELSAYITIENGRVYVDEVEIITSDDTLRIKELGLTIPGDLISGYYIHNETDETVVYTLTDETVYRFVDIGQLYTSEESRSYETTLLEEFLAGSSYAPNAAANANSDELDRPVGRIPYFIEVEGDTVISITEEFAYTI